MGNDLVRFIQGVIGRPTIVSGLSSGGVLSAPGSPPTRRRADRRRPLRGPAAVRRPRPRPAYGPLDPPDHRADVRDDGRSTSATSGASATGPAWSPPRPRAAAVDGDDRRRVRLGDEPPQNLKEYDPEWGRAFWTGTVAASCDHARMLKAVKVPVLFTHHFRHVDEATGFVMGAISDLQAGRVRALVEEAGQPFELSRCRQPRTRTTARIRRPTPTCSSPGQPRSFAERRAPDPRRP